VDVYEILNLYDCLCGPFKEVHDRMQRPFDKLARTPRRPSSVLTCQAETSSPKRLRMWIKHEGEMPLTMISCRSM
jgi:hypothetical protein